MRKRLIALASVAILIAIPGAVLASDGGHSLEQVLVESATTAQDHQALARYYRTRAEAARAEASHHEQMAKTYQAGKSLQKLQMQRHCRKIAESLTTQAAEYEGLASMHDSEARKTE